MRPPIEDLAQGRVSGCAPAIPAGGWSRSDQLPEVRPTGKAAGPVAHAGTSSTFKIPFRPWAVSV